MPPDHKGVEFEKFQISAAILPEIRSHLEREEFVEWKVYFDLDRLFTQWKNE